MKEWWTHNQSTVGVFLVPVATLIASLAGFLKRRGDRHADSIAPSEKRWPYFWSFVLTALCVSLSTWGASLTKRAGEAAYKQSQNTALKTLSELDDMKIQLRIAQHTNSIAISEAKIKALQDDYDDLARSTLGTTPEQKRLYSQLKAQQSTEKKKKLDEAHALKLQKSSERFPTFSFALRSVQEMVNAFGRRSGKTNIITEPVIIPEDIYPEDMKDIHLWSVNISPKLVWQAEINMGWTPIPLPSGYSGEPFLILKFHRDDGAEDFITIHVNDSVTKMFVGFRTNLPAPDPKKITGEYDLQNSDSTLKSILTEVIKAEWYDADESP